MQTVNHICANPVSQIKMSSEFAMTKTGLRPRTGPKNTGN